MSAALPPALRAAGPFIAFATVLRTHDFPVAAEQTTGFLQAIPLLGPRGIADIRAAAHALFAPPPERHAEFDALFRAHFLGQFDLGAQPDEAAEREARVQDDALGGLEFAMPEELNEAGGEATAAELLGVRRLDPHAEAEALRRLARAAPERLPRRRGHRFAPARRGHSLDARRAFREQARLDGDLLHLPRRRRKPRRRALLLLIDVSGSMKERSDAHLAFAHALARATDRIEVFTFGTRLTRVTRALRLRSRDQALAAASAQVPDWDGGTRIGEALSAFLAVPRFAAFARGAFVLVLSDGLERGDHALMVDAVRRLSRRAWRLSWLSPLARGGAVPQTAAMQAVLPLLDSLADGGSTAALAAHVLGAGKVWRS